MEPLKIDPSLDVVSALLALGDVVDGKRSLLIESSGSTGTPKRIELSPAALMASVTATANRLGGHGQWLLALPITFIAGAQVLLRSLVSDQQPVIMNTTVPFTAESFARSAGMMTGERRYTSLVPAQLDRLLAAIPNDNYLLDKLRRFEAVLVGGQAPKAATIEALRDLDVNVVVTYGMAETCGGCVYDGKPLDGVKVMTLGDGRIVLDGPMLAENIDHPFITGDIGDWDGSTLTVRGRADRVIISGGMKLSLEAVEAWTLAQHGVTEAVAVPIENEKFGQGFVCWVVMRDGLPIDASRSALTLGIVAKSGVWRVTESIPKLTSGKPDLQFLTVLANQFGDDFGKK
jgi:O-succinylbenzoic acid--CoA ligase